MISTQRRRDALLAWLRERAAHQGLTAQQIVDVSGIYEGNGRYDTCLADLKAIAKHGNVLRRHGRPARWELP